jgi:hypothetical protein
LDDTLSLGFFPRGLGNNVSLAGGVKIWGGEEWPLGRNDFSRVTQPCLEWLMMEVETENRKAGKEHGTGIVVIAHCPLPILGMREGSQGRNFMAWVHAASGSWARDNLGAANGQRSGTVCRWA